MFDKEVIEVIDMMDLDMKIQTNYFIINRHHITVDEISKRERHFSFQL